jgi:hypothetical protein
MREHLDNEESLEDIARRDSMPNLQAGAEFIKDADAQTPEEEKTTIICLHEYSSGRVILHKRGLWGRDTEMLAMVVYCKKCGRLAGSSRIKF